MIVGVFLFIAASLKTYGVLLDPVSQDSVFSSPPLLIAVIELKIMLGFWLVSGLLSPLCWVASVLFFSILCMASLYLAIAGQRSCSCFGPIAVNPWWTMLFDSGVISMLVLFRPSWTSETRLATSARAGAIVGLGAGTILLVIASFAFLVTGDLSAALAHLRGESITVDPGICQLGDGSLGEKKNVSVRLTNRTGHPVRIIGGDYTCPCKTLASLPLTIAPGETAPIQVVFTYYGFNGVFRREFVLRTDDDNQPFLKVFYQGRVVGGADGPEN